MPEKNQDFLVHEEHAMTTTVLLLFAILFVPADSAERKITGEEILGHVNALCDRSLNGRMALNVGSHRAAEMIAASFERAGLEAAGETGYLHSLNVVLDVLEKDINPEGEELVYEMNPAGLTERRCPVVMARIEGRKADVKEELVLVVARYDGQGRDGRKMVYPGADRNASGVAVMLEVAKALARRPGGVYRTVLFLALPAGEEGIFMRAAEDGAIYERIDNWVLKYLVTSGEWDLFLESDLIRMPGLAGAEALIAESPFPLKKIHAVVDLNMVGRKSSLETGTGRNGEEAVRGAPREDRDRAHPRDLAVVGTETGEGLKKTVEKACRGGALEVSIISFDEIKRQGIGRTTESICFVRKRIPSLWITTGPKDDHGTEKDSPESLDRDQLEKTARFAYRLVKVLANEKDSHTFAR